jgi:hypothetical protein
MITIKHLKNAHLTRKRLEELDLAIPFSQTVTCNVTLRNMLS